MLKATNVIPCAVLLLGYVETGAAPIPADYREFAYAQERGAEAMFILQVVDDRGDPVSGADVWAGMPLLYRDGGGSTLLLRTDQKGECVVKGRTTDYVPMFVSKDGYYSTSLKYNLAVTDVQPRVANGRWQPYGAVRTVVLRKMRNPVCLCKPVDMRARSRRIPAFDQWLDMDCEVFDWLPPHGKGRVSDMQVKFAKDVRARHFDYRYEMTVSFTNNPHAGVYVVPKDPTSDLKGPYAAGTNVAYSSSYVYAYERNKDREIRTTPTSDSCFVFRTRTRADEKGRLLSAHYGYVMGAWCMGDKEMAIGSARFNPTPNDTNLEDEEVARQARRSLQLHRERTRGPKK